MPVDTQSSLLQVTDLGAPSNIYRIKIQGADPLTPVQVQFFLHFDGSGLNETMAMLENFDVILF